MRLQIVQKGLIAHCRLGNPVVERCQVFLVFSQRLTDSLIDKIGQASIREHSAAAAAAAWWATLVVCLLDTGCGRPSSRVKRG